jgi:glycosyltransferase involved in cell wall biosynthesis
VHRVSEGLHGRAARRVARQMGVPLTSSFHTNFPSYGSHYGFGWLEPVAVRYLRSFHAAAAVTIVPTRQVHDQLAAAGFRHLAIVGRGVDTAAFHPGRRSDALRRSWGAGPADLVALVVGRLAPEKNLPLAVRAYRAMAEVLPGTRLVLVGDGPERGRLQAALPDAVFTGMLRGDALAAHYASADVFLFPSLTETFGNVTLEAMASGLAVVAYDDAAAAQHIRPFASGLLAPRGDAAELVAHARRLAQQPDLVRRLGPAARDAVAAVSWEAVGTAFSGLLEAAASRADGRAASSPSRAPGRGAAAPAAGPRGAGGRASGYARS